MKLLDTAIEYISEFGYAVFPVHYINADGNCSCRAKCSSPGKHPIPFNGFKSASKDKSEITKWWKDQGSNIGIATGAISNLIVLDVDPKNGGDESLKQLVGEIGDFETFTVKTGSGGAHFYFVYEGSDILNSASKIGKGLDIRGEGGYVVAPPSNHLMGDYTVANDCLVDDLPEKLKEKILQAKTTPQPSQNGNSNQNGNGNTGANGTATAGIKASVSTPYTSPDNISQGNRNNELTKLAGALRRSGLSELAIGAALRVENQRICQPPLDDAEVQTIAHSVSRYTPDQVLHAISDDPTLSNSASVTKKTTTAVYPLGEFRTKKFGKREVIGFHLAKREWAVLAAIKNVGKSTFLRNMAMCCAAGKPFPPFVDRGDLSSRVLYLDFETTEEMLQPDVNTMINNGEFSSTEIDLIDENFFILPKGLVEGELFTMQNSLPFLERVCRQEKIDLVIVDNLSAGFQVLDESASGVMNTKVVQPIMQFIEAANVALVLCHHAGKSNTNSHYAGRGSSVLEDMATVGFGMDGETHRGQPVTISNVKRKDGQGYDKVFRLNTDRRWFESTTIAPKPKAPSLDVQIENYVKIYKFPDTVPTKDVNRKFAHLERETVNRALSRLVRDGYISRPKQGLYCNFVEVAQETM